MIMHESGSAGSPPRGRVFYDWPGCGEDLEFRDPSQLGKDPYDVVILGAGVVGCALAMELSRFRLRILLLEEKFDVGEGTSKGNSAIIHTGFDASPGTLESRLVTRASRLWPDLARDLKIPLRKTGAVVLALDAEQEGILPALYEKALANGVEDVELLDASRVRELEPYVPETVRGGLLVPRESIADPFTAPVAFAETALANGTDVLFGVRAVSVEDPGRSVKSVVDSRGRRFKARVVVNTAGLGSREITRTYGGELFDINPRRGQFLIYDKLAAPLVNRILLPIPTAKTKGKLVTPTIFGNLLAGPTAEDLPPGSREGTWTTLEGVEEVRLAAEKMCPSLAAHRPIVRYAGARCNCTQGSYQVRRNDGGHKGILTVTGIRSTGLTSSPALARYLLEGMVEEGWLPFEEDPEASFSRPESCLPGWWRRPFEDPERLASRPDYGRLVCFCEQVSLGEILDALDSPLRPRTLDALKRRTRLSTGRCQGFNCLARAAGVMSVKLGIPLERITKRGPGTEILSAGGAGEAGR